MSWENLFGPYPMNETASMPSPYSYAMRIPFSMLGSPAAVEALQLFARGNGNIVKDVGYGWATNPTGYSSTAALKPLKLAGASQFAIPSAGAWLDPVIDQDIAGHLTAERDIIVAWDGVSGNYRRDTTAAGLMYGYKSGNGNSLVADKSTFVHIAGMAAFVEVVQLGLASDVESGGEPEPEPDPEPEPNPEDEECCSMIKLSQILAGEWFSTPVTLAGEAGKHTLFQVHNDLGKKVLLHMIEITPDEDVVARVAINSASGLLPTPFGASACNMLGGGANSTIKRRTDQAASLPTGIHARYKLRKGILHRLHPNYLLQASPQWGLIVALETPAVGATVNFTWREFT